MKVKSRGVTFEEVVRSIVCEHLGVDEEVVVPSARFTEDLNADSLDTVELIMAFEAQYDISISDADAENILTVGDAVEYLKRKA